MKSSPCGTIIKGYYIASGFMGWVPWFNQYMLFETESEYYNYIRNDEEREN